MNNRKTLFLILLLTLSLSACTPIASTVDEPCDWCGNRPSVAYKMSDGSDSYVCNDCNKECYWCGAKATKHYNSAIGSVVFVCNDCYEEIEEFNS